MSFGIFGKGGDTSKQVTNTNITETTDTDSQTGITEEGSIFNVGEGGVFNQGIDSNEAALIGSLIDANFGQSVLISEQASLSQAQAGSLQSDVVTMYAESESGNLSNTKIIGGLVLTGLTIYFFRRKRGA